MLHARTIRNVSLLAPLALLAVYTPDTSAADQNGYIAKYECRADGPICNIDVASLGTRACDQIVSTSTPWSSIDWSKNTICIQAGDHIGKGNLTIPASASGNAGNRKVLRYFRSGDNGADPWRQSSGDQAKLRGLMLDGARYWVVDRLAFPKNTGSTARVGLQNGANNIILNRLLVEGEDTQITDGGIMVSPCYAGTADNLTIQNSVIRSNSGKVGSDADGIGVECGNDIHIVNNELYDFSSHAIQMGHNGGPILAGLVLENNDLYVTPSMYTADGSRMLAENPLTIKAGGAQSNPIRVSKNRIWGARFSDPSRCCIDGGPGAGMSNTPPIGSGFSYVLWENNIVMDSQQGMTWPVGINSRQTIVGNIFYQIRPYYSGWGSHAIEFINNANSEIYLNSIIDASSHYMYLGSGSYNNDIRCNAILASGNREGGTPNAGTIMDNNAFYGTPKFAIGGTDSNVSGALRQRSSSTTYQAGEMLVVGGTDNCTSTSDASCYVYEVLNTGTTSGGGADYCTSLGCTTNDGSVNLQAVRGPYAFYRKLKTGPEQSVIAYARVHTGAPEAYTCPTAYSSRRSIGVSDD